MHEVIDPMVSVMSYLGTEHTVSKDEFTLSIKATTGIFWRHLRSNDPKGTLKLSTMVNELP